MTNVLSLEATPHRLHLHLDDRYAGFAIWEALRLGDYATACQEGLRELRKDLSIPIASRVMEIIGLAYYYLQDYRAAMDIIDQIMPVYTVHPIVLVVHAECLGRMGRSQLAVDLLQTLAESPSVDAETKMLIAGSLHLLGENLSAMRVAAEATSSDPYQGCYMLSLSYYTFQVYGLVQSVEALANQAVHLEPDSIEYRVWLSRVLAAMGKSAEAYHAIARTTEQQIQSLECTCCIAQLCMLFESNGDFQRVQTCLSAIDERKAASAKKSVRQKAPLPKAPTNAEPFRNANTVPSQLQGEDESC